MIEIARNVYIGTAYEAKAVSVFEFRFVNLASTYHYELHQWKRGENHQDDPCYIVHEAFGMISVNWFDGEAKYYDWQGKGVETFKKILYFIEAEVRSDKKVLIFCNRGISRSPTVGLLYLAKIKKELPDNFPEAKEKFLQTYPMYAPKGIADFVTEHWDEI